MRIVASGAGRHRVYEPRSPGQLARILDELQSLAAEELAGADLPPLYLSGVRYKREPAGRAEAWNAPVEVLEEGSGDCEDLASWRAAELNVSGVDPSARAELLRVGPRQLHAIVRRGDGAIEDPSAALGMKRRGRRALGVNCVRDPSGLYRAELIVPAAGMLARSEGVGFSGADALGVALDDLAPELAALDTVPPLDTWSVGFDPVSALSSQAVSALLPYVERALSAAKGWLFGTSYDAFGDFAKAVARSDAQVEPGASAPETIARCLVKGIVPIYCSDSEGTRNNVWQKFGERGWTGKRYGAAYSSGGGQKTWWYGLILRVSDCPQTIRDAAKRRAGEDYQGAMDRTMKLCTDAKSFMRSYGGQEDYEAMILDAVPILPPAPAESPSDTSRVRDSLATQPGGGAVPVAPPAVSSQTSDRLAAVEAIVEPGRLGDWMALARMARVLQREGRRGPFGAMAQSLLRMR